jgi:endoglucanase
MKTLMVLRMRHFPKIVAIISLLGLCSCNFGYSVVQSQTPNNKISVVENPNLTGGENASVFLAALPENTTNRDLLVDSWQSYRQRFIQDDGRVIDYEASDRSTSEGQAYAMLRAVLINDLTTFERTLKWGENNLQRKENGKSVDSLWAWKWGRLADGSWGPIDENFASDGDIDAVTALIFAYRKWKRPEYLELAKIKLRDLWEHSTIIGPKGKRYLLPGPFKAFVPNSSTLHLNPSYLAPYAFRIFAQVDKERDWLSLVESSYEILENSSKLSNVGLPSDWVALDIPTGKYQVLPQSSKIQTLYSFDAYRVWWRVALDAAWFDSEPAWRYLKTSTKHLQKVWRQTSRLPARIDLQGKSLVDYEATSQYAMFYVAMRLIEPKLANEILQRKILPEYKQGIWDDYSAYYTQNLAWLGLLPAEAVSKELLQKN